MKPYSIHSIKPSLDAKAPKCEIIAMCGRFALTASPDQVRETFSLMELEHFPARYNLAPTQPILAIIAGEKRAKGSNLPDRRALLLRWGLIPGWVKNPADFPLLINARSESAIRKPSFTAAMRHRRVLIPASGFYEWQRPDAKAGKPGQAWWLRPKNGGVLALAGLMETWVSRDGSEMDTGAILTTASCPSFKPIHDRMPMVITANNFSRWLDCKSQEPQDIMDLLRPVDDDFFETVAISNLVNKVENTGPQIQEPALLVASNVSPQGRQPSLF